MAIIWHTNTSKTSRDKVSHFCSIYTLYFRLQNTLVNSHTNPYNLRHCVTLIVTRELQRDNTKVKPGGAGSYLRSCRFSESDDRPSKEICQSFENRDEHARNAKDSCEIHAVLSVATRRWKTRSYSVIVYLLLACFFAVVRSLNTTINQDRWNEVPALF